MIARQSLPASFVSLFAAAFVACSEHGATHAAGADGGHGPTHPGTPVTGEASSTAIAAITFDALYVVNGGDSSVSVINTDTNEVAGTIALKNAAFPHHLYLSSDRTKLALAVPGVDLSGGHGGGHGGGSPTPGLVMLLDAATGATLKTRQLPGTNHNAAFAPSGEIWTTQMAEAGKVLALDAATLEDKASIDVGALPAELTFSADGKYAFVANGNADSVTVIDASTRAVAKTIPVGDGPVGAWQGSNGIAYVDNEAGRTLSAIDTKTLEVKLTYNLGFTPAYAALAPDGSLWITDTENGKVVVNLADADTKQGEIPTAAGAHAIAFAGTKTGYITNQEANTVSVIDVATRQVTKTIPVGKKPNGMAWRQK